MNKIEHSLLFFGILLLITVISGCCASPNGDGSTQKNNPTLQGAVLISQPTVLPIVNGVIGGSLHLLVTNTNNYPLNLIEHSINANQKKNIFMQFLSKFNLVSAWNGSIDYDQCLILQANSTCFIKITPNTAQDGGGVVTLKFQDSGKKHTFNVAQVFSYAPMYSSVNGFYLNSTLAKVFSSSGQLVSISIPFVLGDNFDTLTVGHSSPISSAQIICPTTSYTVGSTCTAIITQSGNWNNNYQIIGQNSAGLYTSTNILQDVASSNSVNLLTSGYNVFFESANGGTFQTIYVVNSGNVSTQTITPVSDNPAVLVSSNTCGALAPATSCSFLVSAKSSLNGSGMITINYSPITQGLPPSFNVIYVGPTPSPRLLITADNVNGLTNITESSVGHVLLTINNNGNVDLTNLTFNALSGQLAYNTTGVSSPCALDGSQALSINNSCSVLVNYSPITNNATGSITIMPKASYIDRRGESATYQNASQVLNYSSISQSNLSFSVTGPQHDVYIAANGQSTSNQIFTITNNGQTTATNVYMSILPADPNGNMTINNNCGSVSSKISLLQNESCTVSVTYGPSTQAETVIESMTVSFNTNLSTSYQPWTLYYQRALVSSSLVANSWGTTWSDVTGLGTSTTPFSFTASTQNLLHYSLIYTNIGNLVATNFNVSSNQLPLGYTIIGGGTCPIQTSTVNLGVGSNCTLNVGVVESQYALYFSNTLPGPFNLTMPGYSYYDTATGINQISPGPNTIYVTAASWGLVTNTVTVEPTTHQINITFRLNSIAAITGRVLTPVLVDMSRYLATLAFNYNSPTCSLSGLNSICQIQLTPQVYIPGQYNIRYLYTNALSPTDYLVGTVSFSM